MIHYRARAVLMLFLLLNLIACQTWQSVEPVSPVQFIELDQPDRVRVTGGDMLEVEVVLPSVEGDQLVGLGDFSMPLADILRLETRELSLVRSALAGFGIFFGGLITHTLITCGDQLAC